MTVVGPVLQQASAVTASADVTIEMLDYIVSLREGIMDAWGGILLAYKGQPQGEFYSPLSCKHTNTTCSFPTPALRGEHLPAPEPHFSRS